MRQPRQLLQLVLGFSRRQRRPAQVHLGAGNPGAAEQLMDEAGFQEACQLLYGPLLAQLR